MKVIYIECDAEEMRANRTFLESMSEILSSITRSVAGYDITPEQVADALSGDEAEEKEEE